MENATTTVRTHTEQFSDTQSVPPPPPLSSVDFFPSDLLKVLLAATFVVFTMPEVTDTRLVALLLLTFDKLDKLEKNVTFDSAVLLIRSAIVVSVEVLYDTAT